MEKGSHPLSTSFSDDLIDPLHLWYYLFSPNVDHGCGTRKQIVHLSPALVSRPRRIPSSTREGGRVPTCRSERHPTERSRDPARTDRGRDQRIRATARHRCRKRGAESGVRRSRDPRGQRLPPGSISPDQYQHADGRVWRVDREPHALRAGDRRRGGQGGRRGESGHTSQPVVDLPG